MAKQLMPKAALQARPGDLYLTEEQCLGLSLFAPLKRKPSLDRFPGALVVRHYRKGDIIYLQGEAGWTAFYVLTTEDLLGIRQPQLEAVRQALWRGGDRTVLEKLEKEVAGLEQRAQQLQAPDAPKDARRVATAYLAVARAPRNAGARGPRRGGNEEPIKNLDQETVYIPLDGTITRNYASLRDAVNEGQLFGEMSCLYRTPRAETVVATRDCFVLEMLRNILDQLHKDPAYKVQADEEYRKRVVGLHLRKFSLFADLTDEQFAEVQNNVELVSYEPGQIIFDEHDLPDGVYVIRTGLVKVMKNVSTLVRRSDVASTKELCAAVLEGEGQKAGPKAKAWQLLSEYARAAVRNGSTTGVLAALNELIKNRQLADAKEFKELLDAPSFRERISDLPANRKQWSDQEARRCNRLLVETLYPKGFGLVEMVRIPEHIFLELTGACPAFGKRIEQEAAARKRQMLERLRIPIWDDTRRVQLAPRFQELGLIQGRKLMLIDLERCTRCDECVKACVNTHDDGRSRLFLDGPRFGKYLVPVSCRSCLDPVCLIGCPVGSIHRGDHRQIVIEDWCIGCGLCGSSCPYGSIQMHDVGIVAEEALGWRFLPEPLAGAGWFKPRARDGRWLVGATPFLYDRDLQDALADRLTASGRPESLGPDEGLCFRYVFDLVGDPARGGRKFRLELTAPAAAKVTLWVNGREVKPDKEQRGKREFYLPRPADGPPTPPEAPALAPGGKRVAPLWRQTAEEAPQPRTAPPPPPKAAPPVQPLWKGRNVLAVRVAGNFATGETLLQVRLDEVRKPSIPSAIAQDLADDITEKLVTEKAVVCDLCAGLATGPACVTACPHDAALRVDARFNFPTR
jgi:Fe-S-cluster-containing hydrogenase component 2/CRP-like cAMP-binding protein